MDRRHCEMQKFYLIAFKMFRTFHFENCFLSILRKIKFSSVNLHILGGVANILNAVKVQMQLSF
jgi:hypothetical protein